MESFFFFFLHFYEQCVYSILIQGDPRVLEIIVLPKSYVKGSLGLAKNLQFMFNNWSRTPAKTEH